MINVKLFKRISQISPAFRGAHSVELVEKKTEFVRARPLFNE